MRFYFTALVVIFFLLLRLPPLWRRVGGFMADGARGGFARPIGLASVSCLLSLVCLNFRSVIEFEHLGCRTQPAYLIRFQRRRVGYEGILGGSSFAESLSAAQ